MSEEKVEDVVKCPIYVGDYLVQAYNIGRCAGLKFARVLKVNKEKGNMYVEGIAKSYNDVWEMNSRPYTLQFSDRSMVINAHSMPAKVLGMFEEKYGE